MDAAKAPTLGVPKQESKKDQLKRYSMA